MQLLLEGINLAIPRFLQKRKSLKCKFAISFGEITGVSKNNNGKYEWQKISL